MTYHAPTDDLRFVLEKVVDYPAVSATARFADAGAETTAAILEEAGRIAAEVIAPTRRETDLAPARLENGVVRSAPGLKGAYDAIAEGGWVGLSAAPDHGGMGLPQTLNIAVSEILAAGSLSLQVKVLLSQGQIEALEHHASDALKDLYLPKLNAGEWSGTMNLTEPQAGSDVGALTTQAVENGDGTWAVTGQKIYISWGDSDLVDNVCHLVLARTPGAPKGTRGISLFMVPKILPNADGSLGEANSLRVLSLEHKLGLHGSPTAVMSFEGATGWLVGQELGGMAAMFTMMNNARLGVGAQGIGIAEAAYQMAVAYARDRKQGAAPGLGTIIEHADVKRMLGQMKAEIFAARSIALACAVSIDMAAATGDVRWDARAAFLTPIAKSHGTEVGWRVADQGVQIHGGMGYIEDTGAAQLLRDVRITQIYEGTNGIQAIDLVGRKLADGGDAAFQLIEEIEATCEQARAVQSVMGEAVWSAAETLRETTEWMLDAEMPDRLAGASDYLSGFARVLGGWFHLKATLEDPACEALARLYATRILPFAEAHCGLARAGGADLSGMTSDDLT
ncbi:MAG: acyl-CoA dehydrogenase [Pseudomonadota bacterium]